MSCTISTSIHMSRSHCSGVKADSTGNPKIERVSSELELGLRMIKGHYFWMNATKREVMAKWQERGIPSQ